MSMSSKRLDVLVKLAETKTDEAAEALARSRAGLNEQELRLEELRRYLHEYRCSPLPLSPALIANRERFLARLGEAEVQQQRVVDKAARGVQDSTRHWLDRRAGQQKFDTLQAAAFAREQRVNEQRQQRLLDEFALRRFAHVGSGE